MLTTQKEDILNNINLLVFDKIFKKGEDISLIKDARVCLSFRYEGSYISFVAESSTHTEKEGADIAEYFCTKDGDVKNYIFIKSHKKDHDDNILMALYYPKKYRQNVEVKLHPRDILSAHLNMELVYDDSNVTFAYDEENNLCIAIEFLTKKAY